MAYINFENYFADLRKNKSLPFSLMNIMIKVLSQEQEYDMDWERLAGDIRYCLDQTHGWAILEHFPLNNLTFTQLALMLGLPADRSQDPALAQRVENEFIHLVAAFSERGIALDESRNLYSTSAQAFSLHTDGSALRVPHDAVLLCCFKNDKPNYGITLLITLDQILKRLSAQDIELLQDPVFPFFYGVGPILTFENDNYHIQYNPERFPIFQEKHQVRLSLRHTRAVNALNDILALPEAMCRFSLHPGQCLILNNRNVLHGRTALSKSSKRLLKRIRLYRYGHVNPISTQGTNVHLVGNERNEF